jgi:hypothetical protein
MTKHRLTYEDLYAFLHQADSRMIEKGETPAQAAEAVTGGNRKLDALIVRGLAGESIHKLLAKVTR